MTRSMMIVALLASLLLVLHAVEATADVEQDAAPPIEVTYNLPGAAPGVLVAMQAYQDIDYIYTVGDYDTFEYLEPAPPEPPYDAFLHRDKHKLTNVSWTGALRYISFSVTPGILGEMVEQQDYTLHLKSTNNSGTVKSLSIVLTWNDQGMGFIAPPPPPQWVVRGNTDDASYNLPKTITASP